MTSLHFDALADKLLELGDSLSSTADEKDVHKLRTTCRRIETVLHTDGSELLGAARKVFKATKRLRKAAGEVRDLDVQLAILQKFEDESLADDKCAVLQRMEKTREKRAKSLIAAVQKQLGKKFEARVSKVAGRALESGTSEKHFASRALEGFASVAQGYPALTEDNLHQFRIACKHVRYTAEMDDSALGETIMTHAKRLTDSIGEWHDVLTLSERATKALRQGEQSPLVSALRELQASKLQEALETATKVKAELLKLHADDAKRSVEQIEGVQETPQAA